MKTPNQYLEQIADILGTKMRDGKLTIEYDVTTVAEAKNSIRRFTLQQKQLRQVKREIGQDTKSIRAQYKAVADKAQPSGGATLMGLFGKRGMMKSSVADQRRKLARERDATLSPYTNVSLVIDDVLLQMDMIKVNLTEFIQSEG